MAGLGRRSHYRKHLTDSVLNDLPEPTYPKERIAQIIGSRGGNFFDILVSPPPSTLTPSSQCRDSKNKNQYQECKRRLALLPTKFRKLVWVKRGDYVIVDCGDDEDADTENDSEGESSDTSTISGEDKKEDDDNVKYQQKGGSYPNQTKGGVRYMIQHILYKDQVKHLKSKGLWPNHPNFVESDDNEKNKNNDSIDTPDSLIIVSHEEDEMGAVNKSNIVYEDDGNEYDSYTQDISNNGYLNEDDLLMTANTNRMAQLSYTSDEYESSSESEEEEESSD